VAEDRVAAVEGQPEVLPTPARRDHPAAGGERGEVVGTGKVPAHRSGMEYVDPLDDAAHDVALEATTDDLDLGELGHC
jgi:hypothetical protein